MDGGGGAAEYESGCFLSSVAIMSIFVLVNFSLSGQLRGHDVV